MVRALRGAFRSGGQYGVDDERPMGHTLVLETAGGFYPSVSAAAWFWPTSIRHSLWRNSTWRGALPAVMRLRAAR